MAELSASFLQRPFQRYDMTGYSDHQAQNQLIGFPKVYKGAQPGILTDFVEKNANAILLFDEIEKAHLTTIQLFYQILDTGLLEDKYSELDVCFRDCIIIFTTNAGSSLYDNPNKTGISAANSGFHKRTILNALEHEKNPATGQPAFPQAICSRLSQGYPLLFNHLGINELELVCTASLTRIEGLLERQYYKRFTHDSVLPIALILKEGGHTDARQLGSEAEKFIKTELFKYCSLFDEMKIEEVFKRFDKIHFEAEEGITNSSAEIRELFQASAKPRVLLIANARFASLCKEYIPQIDWRFSASVMETIDVLATEDIDMVLLDIWARPELDKDSEEYNPPMEQKQSIKEWISCLCRLVPWTKGVVFWERSMKSFPGFLCIFCPLPNQILSISQ